MTDDEPIYRDERPRFVVRCLDPECGWSTSVHGRQQSATAVIGHGLRTGHDAEKEREDVLEYITHPDEED